MPGVRKSYPVHRQNAHAPTNLQTSTAPNAFSKLKEAFKGILKNSGKKRQDQQAPPPPPEKNDEQQQQQQSKPAVPPKPEKQAAAAAPPPVAAPDPNTSKPGSASEVKEQPPKKSQDSSPVSPEEPASSTARDNSNSDPVSAISADQDKPLPPPKTDGTEDEAKPAGMLTTSVQRGSHANTDNVTNLAQQLLSPPRQPLSPFHPTSHPPPKTPNPTALLQQRHLLPPQVRPRPQQQPRHLQSKSARPTRKCQSWLKSRRLSKPTRPRRA